MPRFRILTVLLALLLAGCGGDSSDSSATTARDAAETADQTARRLDATLADATTPAWPEIVDNTPLGADHPSGQRFVPNVVAAFDSLSPRADALAFKLNDGPQATTCKHHQGIARKDAADGTPVLFITKSGNVPFPCTGPSEGAGIMVVRMGSPGKHGERMGTNIFPDGRPLLQQLELDDFLWLAPMGPNRYWHPGGMQIVGDVLAIGAETPIDPSDARAAVLFLDVSDPFKATFLTRFVPPDLGGDANKAFGADPLALTAVKNADGSCCRYLMLTAGGPGNEELRFYQSRPDPGRSTTTLKSPSLNWVETGRYSKNQLQSCPGISTWPVSGLITGGQHQMLNFVREGSLDGDLYLIGARRDGLVVNPLVNEYLDLYRVNLNAEGLPAACPLTHVRTKRMRQESWGGEYGTGSFSAASGVHVTPTGELLVYVGNHDTYASDTAVMLGEYRPTTLVRPGSPTLQPTARVPRVVEVDEGATATLTGQGEPAITKAYVQLFGASDLTPPSGFPVQLDLWTLVEYDRRNRVRYDSLDQVPGRTGLLWDRIEAMSWFAPPGCHISANDYPAHSASFPGPDTVLLRGTGRFEASADLLALPASRPGWSPWPVSPPLPGEPSQNVKIHRDIEGVGFYTAAAVAGSNRGCDDYYGAPISLAWDLEGNGLAETTGNTVQLPAETLDGPSERLVRVRAVHPTDRSALGSSPPVEIRVVVRNVPPQIGSTVLTDSAGLPLGPTRPAIAGLPVQLAVSFTDPGRLDTQQAAVDWGDGGALDTTFEQFADALGGRSGALRDRRVYGVAGSYRIAITVTDDDGGAGRSEQALQVLSLRDTMASMGAAIEQLAIASTDPRVVRALLRARDELLGNGGTTPPTNGAINQFDAADPVSTITKLRAAIGQLLEAQALGAGDLSGSASLLALAAEGMARQVLAHALATLPSPNLQQQRLLEAATAFVQVGHERLIAGQLTDACQSFRQATEQALGSRR